MQFLHLLFYLCRKVTATNYVYKKKRHIIKVYYYNDIFVELNTNVLLILDAWGNNGIPFVNGSGTITINEILSTSKYSELSTKFSLDKILILF